jgi:hypothetical protein
MKALLYVLVGLVVGAALGGGLAFATQHFSELQQAPGWTGYPTIADLTLGLQTAKLDPVMAHNEQFHGLLFGGGFGSIVGALLAVAAAIRGSKHQGA